MVAKVLQHARLPACYMRMCAVDKKGVLWSTKDVCYSNSQHSLLAAVLESSCVPKDRAVCEKRERFFPFFKLLRLFICFSTMWILKAAAAKQIRDPKSFNSFENSGELYVFGRSQCGKLFWDFFLLLLLKIIIKTNRLFKFHRMKILAQCCFETNPQRGAEEEKSSYWNSVFFSCAITLWL